VLLPCVASLIEDEGEDDGKRTFALDGGCADPGDYSVVVFVRPLIALSLVTHVPPVAVVSDEAPTL
jgi:hypothetical protein